jgi:hypothetical protein
MDSHAGEPNFDRQSAAERTRQEWKGMKLKKKAKWIKKAADNFREYDEKVTAFCTKNPGSFAFTKSLRRKMFCSACKIS